MYWTGAQPITNRAQNIALSVNGEIYNHVELLEELKEIVPDIQNEFTTDSDCEVLLHLFKVLFDKININHKVWLKAFKLKFCVANNTILKNRFMVTNS